MYIYIYVLMYVCMRMCCVYLFIYLFIYLWVVFTYVCMCVCVCVCVCMCVRFYLCKYMCLSVCMYVCTYDVAGTVRSPTFCHAPFLLSAADKPSIPLLGERCPLQHWCGPLLSAVRGRLYRSPLLIFISRQAPFVTALSLIVR
jgi:hypothetical protein